MGRWQSIRTDGRSAMPIRSRPEAVYLPISASGRLFARRHDGDRVTLLQRRPREVYRVCSEDEYLAGIDPFADWDARPVEAASRLTEQCAPALAAAGSSRERRLRRFAGAAALTGAVGTVGGTIALVGLRPHAVDRQIAAVSPAARLAPTGAGEGASADAGAGAARVVSRVVSSPNVVRGDAVQRDGWRRDGVRRASARREGIAGNLHTGFLRASGGLELLRNGLASPRARGWAPRRSHRARHLRAGIFRPKPQPARYAPAPVAGVPQDTPPRPWQAPLRARPPKPNRGRGRRASSGSSAERCTRVPRRLGAGDDWIAPAVANPRGA